LLLVIPPVALASRACCILLPPEVAPPRGGEFQKIMRHADLWIASTSCRSRSSACWPGPCSCWPGGFGPAATMARVAVVPFAAFYSAFDAVPGLSKGLLARYAQQHPAQVGVITAGSSAVDALEDPAIVIVYAIGVACWLLADGGVASALRGHAPAAGIVLRPAHRGQWPDRVR
jgi:hypothetical protein